MSCPPYESNERCCNVKPAPGSPSLSVHTTFELLLVNCSAMICNQKIKVNLMLFGNKKLRAKLMLFGDIPQSEMLLNHVN
jgi:hypothetical protein